MAGFAFSADVDLKKLQSYSQQLVQCLLSKYRWTFCMMYVGKLLLCPSLDVFQLSMSRFFWFFSWYTQHTAVEHSSRGNRIGMG